MPVRARPNSVASGAGSVWVTNTDDDSVSRIDPVTKAVRADDSRSGVDRPGSPSAVASSGLRTAARDGLEDRPTREQRPRRSRGRDPGWERAERGRLRCSARVWVANVVDRTVTPIDPMPGVPASPIGVGTGADGIAVGRGRSLGDERGRQAPSPGSTRGRGREQPINVGSGPTAVAVGAGSVWVANSLDGTVSRIDPGSNQVTCDDSGRRRAERYRRVAGNVVWVSNELAGTLSRIDPTQNKVVQDVTTGNRPAGRRASTGTQHVRGGAQLRPRPPRRHADRPADQSASIERRAPIRTDLRRLAGASA